MKPNTRRLLDDIPYIQTRPPPTTTTYTNPTVVASAASTSVDVQFNSLSSMTKSMAVTALVLISALFFLSSSVCARRFFTDNHGHTKSSYRRRRPPPSQHHQFGRSSFMASSSSSSYGLDPSRVRSLPVLSYAHGVGKEAGCVVCLSEFEEESVKLIPGCGHMFHPQCIDVWLGSHGSCPLCRSTQLFGLGMERGEVCLDFLVGSDGEEDEGGGVGSEEEEEVESRVVEVREREVEGRGGEEGKVVLDMI